MAFVWVGDLCLHARISCDLPPSPFFKKKKKNSEAGGGGGESTLSRGE